MESSTFGVIYGPGIIGLVLVGLSVLLGLGHVKNRRNRLRLECLAELVSGVGVLGIAASTGMFSLDYGIAHQNLIVLVGGVLGGIVILCYGLSQIVGGVAHFE